MKLPVWTPAYIGIGSNLDNPRQQVERGIDALGSLPQSQLISRSSLYRSAPMGPQDQPYFVNAATGLLTQLDAASLLSRLKALEKKLGRNEPIVRWGPRVIDFDLLVYDSAQFASDELRVPHPGIAERAFVLVPLMQIAPHLDVPGIGRIEKLAAQIDQSSVERL
jgi:2-amino-4-hydroxy-6-hydroxymethyldihydropteridine diphosphokinase